MSISDNVPFSIAEEAASETVRLESVTAFGTVFEMARARSEKWWGTGRAVLNHVSFDRYVHYSRPQLLDKVDEIGASSLSVALGQGLFPSGRPRLKGPGKKDEQGEDPWQPVTISRPWHGMFLPKRRSDIHHRR